MNSVENDGGSDTKLILTVCNGNIHRSVIAAVMIERALMKRGIHRQYRVESRGIAGSAGTDAPLKRNIRGYPMEWSLTSKALATFDINMPEEKQATPITRGIAEEASVILAMDRHVLEGRANSLRRQFPDLGAKIYIFTALAGRSDDIPDLFRSDDEQLYIRVVEDLHAIIENNLEVLLKLADASP